jgi:hypothetical protein
MYVNYRGYKLSDLESDALLKERLQKDFEKLNKLAMDNTKDARETADQLKMIADVPVDWFEMAFQVYKKAKEIGIPHLSTFADSHVMNADGTIISQGNRNVTLYDGSIIPNPNATQVTTVKNTLFEFEKQFHKLLENKRKALTFEESSTVLEQFRPPGMSDAQIVELMNPNNVRLTKDQEKNLVQKFLHELG